MKYAIKIDYNVARSLKGVMTVGETWLQEFNTFAEMMQFLRDNPHLAIRTGQPFHLDIPDKESMKQYIDDKELPVSKTLTLDNMKLKITEHYESLRDAT